jgi:hypothetical protein
MQRARQIVGKYQDWPKVGHHVLGGVRAYEIIRPTFVSTRQKMKKKS